MVTEVAGHSGVEGEVDIEQDGMGGNRHHHPTIASGHVHQIVAPALLHCEAMCWQH